jgi:hypothetical protein
MLLKERDRVRHRNRTDWGLGEVLHDEADGKVEVIFEDVGLKKFSVTHTPFIRVTGEEADSPTLTALVKYEKKKSKGKPPKKGSHQSFMFTAFPDAVKKFLTNFPSGFHDPAYLSGDRNERDYKLKAQKKLQDLLGHNQLAELIQTRDYDEVWTRAHKVMASTNMIHHFEIMWLTNALNSAARRQLFAIALRDLLYGAEPDELRFGHFFKALYSLEVAKWPLATYLPFLAYPERYIFLKPEATKHAADSIGFNIEYEPELNWKTYSNVLKLAAKIEEKLNALDRPELQPEDMIDIQSFIWIIQPSY